MAIQKINSKQSYVMKRQDNTTNSTINAPKIQVGFGAVALGGQNHAAENVVFPEPFSSPPIVIIGSTGEGNGTSINSMSAASGSYAQLSGVTSTGFTARILSRDGSSTLASVTFGYSWIAIGE